MAQKRGYLLVGQINWLAPGKPLPALILLVGIIMAPISIPYALSRTEFQYLNNVEIRTYPNLASGLLVSIPSIILAVFGFLLFYGRINLSSRDLALRYSILLAILATLGIISPIIVCTEAYVVPSVSFWMFIPLWIASPFGFFSTIHVINGIVGLYISKRELKAKHSKFFGYLFGSIAVLGIIFVTLAILFLYWTITGSPMFYLLSSAPLMGDFLFFCLLSGPVFVTVGLLGIGRKYLMNNQNLFTVLALLTIIAIPLCIFALVCYSCASALTVGF
jgi:hypothetical protein